MAIFKLGSIITSIAGSIGGTTFRRGIQNPSMYNKSLGASRNTLLQNKQLNPIAIIWKQWSLLTTNQRTVWNQKALLFTFPDKFGVQRNITGRQLFNKLNVQLLPTNTSIIDATYLSDYHNAYNIDSCTIDPARQIANIEITTNDTAQKYLIQVESQQKQIFKPTFTRSKAFVIVGQPSQDLINMGPQFFADNRPLSAAYTVIIYVTAINDSGFKSAAQFIYADVV
jgi:hypothetical protein